MLKKCWVIYIDSSGFLVLVFSWVEGVNRGNRKRETRRRGEKRRRTGREGEMRKRDRMRVVVDKKKGEAREKGSGEEGGGIRVR